MRGLGWIVLFLIVNNVQVTAEIAASNLDVLVSSISAIAAIIAGIAALVGVAITIGARGTWKTKVTEALERSTWQNRSLLRTDLI